MGRGSQIEPRPYRLRNRIMDYAWGTRDEAAFIPRMLGIEAEPGAPYAELWMGAHPKAPSEIELGGWPVPLDAAIARAPEAILGAEVVARFGGTLPFLLKVLSAGRALSIQAHPNIPQAVALHAQDSEHYPDDNHKPEVAVALGPVRALAGFRPLGQIAHALETYPELAGLVAPHAVAAVRDAVDTVPATQAQAVYWAFTSLLETSALEPDALGAALDRLDSRLRPRGLYTGSEIVFLELRDHCSGADVGLFAPFFLNTMYLEAGQGLYTPSGVPHAYLGGDLIECMANSDNVVRVGLTPKYRDAPALAKILDPTPGRPAILEGAEEAGRWVYRTPAAEFMVRRSLLRAGAELACETGGRPEILIITGGRVALFWEGGVQRYARGQSALIPACLARYVVRAESDAEWFAAAVPGHATKG